MRHTFIALLLISGFVLPSWSAADNTTAQPGAAHDVLNRAKVRVEEAISIGEASLGPHQPGSGWTKKHMQQVIAILEGDKSASDAGTINTLETVKAGLGQDVTDAVESSVEFLQAAVEHARLSVQAKTIDETHREARLATGLLVAARGNADAKSPVTGGLEFAARQLK